eukprot:3516971-Pleurochrysis_carterae.AAC.1
MKKKADRVAVITARRPCMMAMYSEGCAGAMALSTVGRQDDAKRSACQSSNAGNEVLLPSVMVTAFISASPEESAESLS